MSSSFLEIVELEDGTYALQRIDSDDEPLVVVTFSDEVSDFLQNNQTAVVKAMMGAGVQTASTLSKAKIDQEEKDFEERTLH